MIRVDDLHLHFGGIRAVDGASIEIAKGSITGLIGPNGAGKSTLFNVIAGLYKPTSGRVWLDGEEITGLSPHELFHKGLLRTFQIAHEFSTLTVRENLMMVPADQPGEVLWDAWFKGGAVRAREAEVRRRADEVIEFLEIGHVAEERAGNLSGGQKKLLELGRTMMVDAKIVFLDEVGAGVNRTLLNTIGDAILRLNRERGYTFCMVEHDMDFIGRLCNPVIVMAEGRVLTEGTSAEVLEERGGDRGLSRPRPQGTPRPGRSGRVSYLIGEAMTGGYGGADILTGCTIAVDQGEIAVIVGPNGAGKSTAMKAVFGMLKLREGVVRLDGRDITALSPQDRVKAGMGFVPQNANVFVSLTVEENLEMGAFIRDDDFSGTMRQVFDLFPILKEKRRQPAGELSGGQRQQVAVGRALMTRPRVLMLDEPTAGVSPIVMDELFDKILDIAATGIAILMVEQNARQALNIADKGYVLVQGSNRFTDTGAALLADPEVRRSFLGG